MDKGYVDNGFIVDLTSAKKTSEIIYELSRILDMPESKQKHICLKLGSVDLSESELKSVKALVELMDSQLAFISTSSANTVDAATALDIKISEFTNNIEAPKFENKQAAQDALNQLDGIYPQDTQPVSDLQNAVQDDISPIVREDESSAETQDSKIEKEICEEQSEPEKLPTLYLRKTIRSGQSISSDGNLVIIGDVNPGAEVIAKGDITVWGILGGIAHAGKDGDSSMRIRALKLNPVQIRIGEIFARRPDTINLPYVQKSSQYMPEEAYTHKGNIVIRKIHEGN